jgi:hypothetical protein
MVLTDSGLAGGKDGTKPTVTFIEYVPGSNDAFLDPVPAELFYTAHDTPQLQVVTNGLYSVCADTTCNLVVTSDHTPSLSAYTYTSATGALSLTLDDPRSSTFAEEDVSVEFAG